MKTLVEDEEIKRLRAMAEGSKSFKRPAVWEGLAAKDLKEFWKLPARERKVLKQRWVQNCQADSNGPGPFACPCPNAPGQAS